MLHVVRGGEEGKCQGLKEGVARGELGSRKWRQKKGMAETTGGVRCHWSGWSRGVYIEMTMAWVDGHIGGWDLILVENVTT